MSPACSACLFLDLFSHFSNQQYSINDISFEWSDEEKPGMGHADGSVTYNALLENGETVVLKDHSIIYE
jgi:hypothetical protein